jgi:carbonic anhydrase
MNDRICLLVGAILFAAITLPATGVSAAGCPHEPEGWDYTDLGPATWNVNFAVLCGAGTRQSPINIQTKSAIPARLPKIKFHYNVADVVTLDHDDNQTLTGAQAGNYISLGGVQYFLYNIHAHTPSEHTINGNSYPLELHIIHKSAAGQLVVVAVLVREGKPETGIIDPPSEDDPSTVDFKLTDLIPRNRRYWSYDGSLTTPGATPTTLGCPESILWLVMTKSITMSADQLQAFKDSSFACWETENNARPTQPINNRLLFISPQSQIN